ncbi:MAG: ABC transporter substrate-binding protein [Anaerolineae bacterium]|nr:ABC transporter substrate-binding protein [Anaerolineae bacterium]
MRSRALLRWAVIGLMMLLAGGIVLAQQPEFVRLGLLAAADSPAGRGVQLAIAEINGSGGITGPGGTLYAFELLSVPVATADEVRAGLEALADRDLDALLGPDDTAVALATFNDLRALRRPVFTAAVGDSLTIADMDDTIFRSRAPEQVVAQAAVAYLAEIASGGSVVIVQNGSSGVTEQSVAAFTAALGNRGIIPRSTLQLNDAANLDSLISSLRSLNPDVLAVWGGAETAAELLFRLRDGGWAGVYLYRDADDPVFREALLAQGWIQQGIVAGITSWAPGVNTPASIAFVQHYVETFGEVPDAFSAAAYDAVYMLAAAIQQAGGTPAELRQGLMNMPPLEGVQGELDPAQYLVGETISAAAAFQLNAYAVPQVTSRYVNGELVANQKAQEDGAGFRATPLPTVPPVTPTPEPTATPEGVWGIVDTGRLNVRTGPGMNYDAIGQLDSGDVIFPIGANLDFTWLVVPFRGQNGWVAAYLVDLRGPRNQLPFFQPPPTPTPVIIPTDTPVPFGDLAVISARVEPARPLSGQQFVVRAFVRNLGQVSTPESALAASFQPGEEYASGPIPALAPGQTAEVILRPTVSGSGTYTVQLVVDLNNVVNEGPTGESNNLYPVTYTLDQAALRSGTVVLSPGQQHDVMGSGTPILSWDGAVLAALNGAQVAVLPALNWNTLAADQLIGVTGGAAPRASMPVGAVVGVITAPEGYRGALRVDAYNGDTIQYSYRIYAP